MQWKPIDGTEKNGEWVVLAKLQDDGSAFFPRCNLYMLDMGEWYLLGSEGGSDPTGGMTHYMELPALSKGKGKRVTVESLMARGSTVWVDENGIPDWSTRKVREAGE